MTERKVFPVRLSAAGTEAVEKVAERNGVSRSEAGRLLLAFACRQPPGTVDRFIRDAVKAQDKEQNSGK